MRKGSDGNTLMDNCEREISEGRSLPFKVITLLPTPMDSLVPVKCAPNVLQLYFKKKILCNTIAADGSNFVVSGPSSVAVKAAAGDCSDGGSNIINITLANPVVHAGTYKIVLQPGSLGNTIIDECGQATPAGSSLFFSVKDTVSADFKCTLSLGCTTDTINCTHDGRNGITDWNWKMAEAGNSKLQSPMATYDVFGTKQISLIVSNGFCADTLSKSILLDNELKADFETNDIICPEDSAFFKNKSIGQIISNQWIFGNGNVRDLSSPNAEKYPLLGIEKFYPVQLIVSNGACADTAVRKIKVLSSCYIAVAGAFTPNGDGLNDFLYPVNAFKTKHLQFKVYNRSGLLIYSSNEWTQKWDGTYKGQPQDSGMYVWTLSYTHLDTGKNFFLKGSTMLIR